MFSKGFWDGDSTRTTRVEPFARTTSAFRPPSEQISRYPTTTAVTTMGRESGWARRDAGLEMADIGCATSIGPETKEETQANLPIIHLGASEVGLDGGPAARGTAVSHAGSLSWRRRSQAKPGGDYDLPSARFAAMANPPESSTRAAAPSAGTGNENANVPDKV